MSWGKLLIGAILVTLSFSSQGCSEEQRPKQQNRQATHPIRLVMPTVESRNSLESVLKKRRSLRSYGSQMPDLKEVSQILWATQGISNHQLQFRTAPSAGALYPLEVYLVAGRVASLATGLYHYDPTSHSLKQLSSVDCREDLSKAAVDQEFVKNAPAVIILCAVFDRTTKRYGDRGLKYVYMEAGHAGQNLCLQVESLGMGAVPVGAFDDERVIQLLSLSHDETPVCIFPFGKKP